MKLFDSIKVRAPKKSKFDLSHEKKLSIGMDGNLIPIMAEEVIPGDEWRVRSEILLRFAPLLAPMMHRVNVYTHFFFVPNRLLWDEWQDFITGGKDGTSAPVPPQMGIKEDNKGAFAAGSLADYLGIPTIDPTDTVVGTRYISLLPFRAYQLIWNEYFRDQTLAPEVPILKIGGLDPQDWGECMQMRRRAWEKDYFTSALPWAQRGPSIGLPIEANYSDYTTGYNSDTGAPSAQGALSVFPSGIVNDATGNPVQLRNIEPGAQNVDINDLRRSVRLQEWFEKNARAGARYVEQILSHWGVVVPDSRLQRPEFLSSNRVPVAVSEVLSNFQFSGDAEGQPQGHMAGHGISVGNGNGFRKRFVEHGWVIGVMSVLPKTAYQQGIPKKFLRQDKFEYAWPEFANIGEQEVQNRELFVDYTQEPTLAGDELTFGYQSRYAEYKYVPSTVHGEFRNTLSHWHMGRIFTAKPSLNQSFVEANPTTRIFAVPSSAQMYVQIYHKVDALRPLPYFGTPRL